MQPQIVVAIAATRRERLTTAAAGSCRIATTRKERSRYTCMRTQLAVTALQGQDAPTENRIGVEASCLRALFM